MKKKVTSSRKTSKKKIKSKKTKSENTELKGLINAEIVSDERSQKVNIDSNYISRPSIEVLKKKYGNSVLQTSDNAQPTKSRSRKKSVASRPVKAILIKQKNILGSDKLLGSRTVVLSGNKVIGSQG